MVPGNLRWRLPVSPLVLQAFLSIHDGVLVEFQLRKM